MKFSAVCAAFLLATGGVVPAATGADVSKWDPRMAVGQSTVSNGVRWIDGRAIPIEGRAFDDTETYYERLPRTVTTNVNEGVRYMKAYTAGLAFHFRTDSRRLHIRWKLLEEKCDSFTMPATGKRGVDVYRFDEPSGRWRFVKCGNPGRSQCPQVSLDWRPGEECLVNFPTYDGVRECFVGIDEKATIAAPPPRRSGIDRPVVFYGTSITHGGCASRPGMAFPAIVGRNLDVPVVNLGFSGCGAMELEMSDHLAAIDASCYVLDCIWNMGGKGRKVEENYEPFIRNLRAKRPGVPIVMAESCEVHPDGSGLGFAGNSHKHAEMRKIHDKLVAEGWKDLVYLPKEGMLAPDTEGTVDGLHPNDWGMVMMARAYGGAIDTALHAAAKPGRETVVYVAAHPDDLGGSIGTMIRLAEKYDVHVIDYTHGERGLGEKGYRDGTTAKTRMAEEEEVCRRIGATLHWCDEIDGEASADRATVERLASLYRVLKPRALFVHWPVDTHMDHVMSAAAALDATRLAGISPEIYFHEQDIQSRGFRPDYWVNVTALAERQRELISLWKCQNGPQMAERKLQTTKTNALRIRTEWDEDARYECFAVFPGTVPTGKGIFDSMDGVLR